MKRLALTLSILTLSIATFAQVTSPEPELNDVFVRLDGSKLIPLERASGAIRSGGGGFMVASAKASTEFQGAKSPVRFEADHPLDFVVRTPLAGTATDPSTMYVLRKLTSKKNTREAVFMSGKFSPFGGSMKTDPKNGAIPITFERYGSTSLKVSTAALQPGEYAFSRVYGQDAYCFGVD